ncbi:uncharacterized protein DUF2802 [Tamilnaduibacter salinus]|uniref:Uncharacterized protein DUF2802 n=1 Tax=Tamilnaduibacter salinus TaxID=1484056 RepID=A0A2A2I5L9_9GAMM|nr:DUF2802 domain-containing protein [Tamilnaduibacter salinus]PAV26435.1 hypothetical protein CF392_05740 [Tamilnaduibacter salinus]PVY79280.1 uncharacterized protein DUF2802 [Tamilnaduibacter salinus]
MTDWMMLAPWALTMTTLALLCGHAIVTRRRLNAMEARFRDRLETLGRELHATSSGSLGVGNRVVRCERELHELHTTVEEMRQNDPLRVSYDEASRLVDLGADVDDLMNTCGISRPEAELVAALKRRQAA